MNDIHGQSRESYKVTLDKQKDKVNKLELAADNNPDDKSLQKKFWKARDEFYSMLEYYSEW